MDRRACKPASLGNNSIKRFSASALISSSEFNLGAHQLPGLPGFAKSRIPPQSRNDEIGCIGGRKKRRELCDNQFRVMPPALF